MIDFRQSQFSQQLAPENFLWCTGIEDTFITAPFPRTGRTLDEYELTGHYDQWSTDLELMAELGVRSARYGIPWHRINPQRGTWDFKWADDPLEKMLSLGIAPIVDLVHYGLPSWIENAFLHPDYPHYVAEYATRIAERFRGRIHAYTPLNEPRITAWYCGRLGWWPPFQRSWKGFVAVMHGVCRGIVETVHALKAVDPEILPVHVDATDLYTTLDETLQAQTEHRQELVFLALDLISGRIVPEHPLHAWLARHGFAETDFAWFQDRAIPLPFIGINLYPMFTQKVLRRAGRGTKISMMYAKGDLIDRLAEIYWARYHAPLFISETASTGSVRRRADWLEQSIDAVRRVRSAGIPLVGYTWWPLFALVTWAYRQGDRPPAYYLKQMGLWDLDEHLRRVPTKLVQTYRSLVDGGIARVGPLTSVEVGQPSPT